MNTIQARFHLHRPDFFLQVEFEIPACGVTAVFGQSGAGKSTLLRCLAGLENAPGGLLRVNGEEWQNGKNGVFLPPHRRALGYVFQDARLFPHLSVLGNLTYGLKRTPAVDRQVSMEQAIQWLGVEALLRRYPHQLSGGEKQRVAIARALLTGPRLLIMDEPLASLDAASKAEILPYLERLHGALSIPVVYVSHALDEVERLADRMIVLQKGRIIAQGPLAEIVTRLDLPLAHLDEAGAVLETTVAAHDDIYGLTYLDFSGGRIAIGLQNLALGQRVRARILAKDVSLALKAPELTSIQNIFHGTVAELMEHNPTQVLVKLRVGEADMLARITRKSASMLDLRYGLPVYVQVKSVALAA